MSNSVHLGACVRPFTEQERNEETKTIMTTERSKIVLGGDVYNLDDIYSENNSSRDCFAACGEALINSAVNGVNGAFIVFGGERTGKSHLLNGSHDTKGFVELCIEALFTQIKKAVTKTKTFLVTASHIQFNENRISDLLNPHNRGIEIIDHPEFGSLLKGVSEFVLQSMEEAGKLYSQANQASQAVQNVGTTSVFSMTIHQKTQSQTAGLQSKLMFVHLAAIDKKLATEGIKRGNIQCLYQYINSISEEKKPDKQVESNCLTQYLKDAIGGNCSTSICATLAPGDNLKEDTAVTLKLVGCFKKIKNKPKKNEDTSEVKVEELRKEIQKLRTLLMEDHISEEDVHRFETLLSDLEIAKEGTWTEKMRKSQRFQQERRGNLADKGLSKVLQPSGSRTSTDMDKKRTTLGQEKAAKEAKFSAQQTKVIQLKEKIRVRMEQHTSNSGSMSQDDMKKQASSIQQLSVTLDEETAALRGLRSDLLAIEDRLERFNTSEAALGLHVVVSLKERREMEQRSIDRREKASREFLEEATKRLTDESKIAGKVVKPLSPEEAQKLYAQDKIKSTEMTLLREENAALKGSITSLYTDYEAELDNVNAAYFETFREYREAFEVQKHEIERRYRALLEDSLKDAIFLSGRNSELELIHGDLRAEIANLRDQLTLQ